MSSQKKSPRTCRHKKRKLHYDSDEISLDRNLELCIDCAFEKNSQTSSKNLIDLFGEIIPPAVCISNVDDKKKSVKKTPRKTPVSRKKKLPYEDNLIDTPVIRPKRVFIPTPRFIKVMKEAQKELYSIMNSSPSNVSIVSTDSLNISGVQNLQDSPITTIRNEPKIKKENNDKKSQEMFKGVVLFVDYKIDNNRCHPAFVNHLTNSGAKVEKTFNRKVTHVMFCDGYRSTYRKAVERNIPLVSARWMEYSKRANKILDPAVYPPVGTEKYTKSPSKIIKIPKCESYKKFLEPSDIERNQLSKSNCDTIMELFNLEINRNKGNEEKCSNNDSTPQTSIVNEQDDIYKSIRIANILSDDIRKVLNESDNPVPDELMGSSNVPTPIRILRMHLTPNGKKNTTFEKLDSQLVKMEEQLNLNFLARKRFRKLLFPSDEDLNNIHEVIDFPTQTKDSDSRMSINSTIDQTPKDSFADNNMVLQSIACTGMTKSETKTLKSSIKNLGKFNFHTKVKPMTTYLITKSQSNQSLDIVFAMSYGCFIVSEDWVHESHRTGKWLSHQRYLISELLEPVKEFQVQRHSTFGSVTSSRLKFHIFDNAGKIYISDTCKSPAKLLKRLVNACGGHCTSTKSIANVVIGGTPQMDDNIHEKWILDCISQGILLNKNQYKLVNTNEY